MSTYTQLYYHIVFSTKHRSIDQGERLGLDSPGLPATG